MPAEWLRERVVPTEAWWSHLQALGEGGKGAPAAGDAVLEALVAAGVPAFTLAEVTRLVAPACRDLLAARRPEVEVAYEEDVDGLGSLVPIVRPDGLEGYRAWQDFVRETEAAILRQTSLPARREALLRVFRYLVALVDDERLEDTNQRTLAEELGLPRSTASDYIQALRAVILDSARTPCGRTR